MPLNDPEELLVPDDTEFTEIIELGLLVVWVAVASTEDVVLMKEFLNFGAEI